MINEIDEQRIRKLDAIFKTKSRVFPNVIYIDSGSDEWQLQFTDRLVQPICLLHKNKNCRKNKYHFQRWKSNILFAYQDIYRHRKRKENVTREMINE